MKGSGQPGRVLVVDDEASAATLLQETFEEQGFTVSVASDGREATAVLEREEFDYVFLDVMMPHVGGLEVLKWIRCHPTKKNTWVALMTAMANDMDGATRDSIGADHYVSKPLDPSKLFPSG